MPRPRHGYAKQQQNIVVKIKTVRPRSRTENYGGGSPSMAGRKLLKQSYWLDYCM